MLRINCCGLKNNDKKKGCREGVKGGGDNNNLSTPTNNPTNSRLRYTQYLSNKMLRIPC